MPSLIAKCPILHKCKQYGTGDKLPTSDPVMLQAWLNAGSAEWQEEEPAPKKKAAKAVPVTAEPGMPGISQTGDPDDLIGKIPKTGRKK